MRIRIQEDQSETISEEVECTKQPPRKKQKNVGGRPKTTQGPKAAKRDAIAKARAARLQNIKDKKSKIIEQKTENLLKVWNGLDSCGSPKHFLI